MTARRVLLLGYLLLLLASSLVRLTSPDPGLHPGQDSLILPDGSRQAWWSEGPEDGLPVLLLHGSPGEGAALRPMSGAFPSSWYRVAPDMLGFGGSSHRVTSYASRSHAEAMLHWMDAAGIDSMHLVAHSMGGAVALELADRAPERVRSVTMIGAIGVVELELLGSHILNHAIHGAQLAAVEAAATLLPHFGLLDRFPLNRSYARNFYDTDQRRLRPILASYDGPMLIVHGDQDFLVPPEAAIEHHRIVPQSELLMLDSDHFFVFRPDDLFAPVARVVDFIGRVESGAALARSDAPPGRQAAAVAPFDPNTLPEVEGVALLVTAVLIWIATFISEDLTCIASGLLVAQGRLGFVFASAACAIGLFIGDILLVIIGRWVGPAALRRAPLSWMVTPEAVEEAAAWYRRYGAQVIFTSRAIPGMRLPMYFAAGVLKVPLPTVSLLFATAASLWAPLLVGGAILIGEPVLVALDGLRYGSLLLIGLLIVTGLMLRVTVPLLTWRGRRLAYAWWLRVWRWEFWPMWMVYPPVIAAAVIEAIRLRSPTAFTAANPGMPASGFVGESKWDIFCRLGGAHNPALPATELLTGTPAQRQQQGMAFIAAHGYPVVLKPDAGQRGQGVSIVRTAEGLNAYLSSARGAVLIQAYAPGEEFGVFYVRYPDEPAGMVTSITHKRPVRLSGDGIQTLEQLILRSPDALPKAPLHLRVHAPRLMDVPQPGETITLVEVGTHSRGSRFYDAGALNTPALCATIDRISQGFDGGFCYGRYDIRAPSDEALARGEDLMVLEVNGVTSEPTHIYDPKMSVWSGWRSLITHWQHAFRIGAANINAGTATATSLRALLAEVRQFQEHTRREHVAVDRPLPPAKPETADEQPSLTSEP